MMSPEEKKQLIESRIQQAFTPHHLEVIDDSDQHVGHAGHQGGGRHFTVIIAANSLKDLARIDAHRKIYALFTELMPDEIHALRIKIVN